MKILIPIYEIQDYGGIVAHTEWLIKGLTEHGHESQLVILRNNDQEPYIRKAQGPVGSYPSATGGSVHLLAGWYGVPVMSYGTLQRAYQFLEYAKDFDYIIWDLPVPYNGEGFWRPLYESNVPQVAVVHDAHYPKTYKPQLDSVAQHLLFVAPVNESAYGSLESYPGVRRMICNGHPLVFTDFQKKWEHRPKKVVCAHVWKAWKHMDVAVAASIFTVEAHVVLGGDGIEGRYMRSKDKCKPKYKGLWEAFQNTTHEYKGILTAAQLMEEYLDARVMMDLSYNARFNSYGSHFNRSMVEGINYGCIPLVAYENVKDSAIWKPGVNCMAMPVIEPEAVASYMDCMVNWNSDDAEAMLAEGRRTIRDHFDYMKTSALYLAPPTPAEQSEALARRLRPFETVGGVAG